MQEMTNAHLLDVERQEAAWNVVLGELTGIVSNPVGQGAATG